MKILNKIFVQIFDPIKNGVIEKLVKELKLQNMIFKAQKNKTKSKT